MKKNTTILLILLSFYLFTTKASAQPETFFPNPDLIDEGFFGVSTAVNENYAVVGSYNNQYDYDGSDGFHPVYVFEKDSIEGWRLQATLLPLDYTEFEFFGENVAISDENVIVVSNSWHSNAGFDEEWESSGAIYVFERENEEWVETAYIPHPVFSEFRRLGYRVAIDGDYIIVSDIYFESKGAAFIFHKESGGWVLQAELFSTTEIPIPFGSSIFGVSVAIKGDYAMVTESISPITEENHSRVHIYKRDGDTWEEEMFVAINSDDTLRHYGTSMAMEDSIAIIAALPFNDSGVLGYVEVLNLTDTGWQSGQKLWPNPENAKGFFGFDVAIEGTKILVSALIDDTNGTGSGKAYLFTNDGSEWSLAKEILPENGREGQGFSYSVALSHSDAVIGSPAWDSTAMNESTGAVHFFDLSGYNVATNYLSPLPFELSLHPNPSSGYLNIALKNVQFSSPASIHIYDVLGHLVVTKTYPRWSESVQLDIGELSAGLYFCEVEMEGRVSTASFVKE